MPEKPSPSPEELGISREPQDLKPTESGKEKNLADKKETIPQRDAVERSWLTARDFKEYQNYLGFEPKELRGKTVLDLGSGRAEIFGKEAAQRDINVVSLNPKLGNLSWPKRVMRYAENTIDRLRYSKYKQQVTAGVAQEMPFRDSSFDGVFALYTFLWIPSEQKSSAVKEIVRVLKPGGEAIIAPVGASKGKEFAIGEDVLADIRSEADVSIEEYPAFKSRNAVGLPIHQDPGLRLRIKKRGSARNLR